jgi:hypothetical protein
MSRPRTIPDSSIFAAILHMIEVSGERSVAFSSVSRATGLAAPSLVQRYGSLTDMIHQALAGEWSRLELVADQALTQVKSEDKGLQALLKALSPGPGAALLAATMRHPDLAARAAAWRSRVVAALAEVTGDMDRAEMLFALWSGQGVWEGMAPRGFRLKDAIKRLG